MREVRNEQRKQLLLLLGKVLPQRGVDLLNLANQGPGGLVLREGEWVRRHVQD